MECNHEERVLSSRVGVEKKSYEQQLHDEEVVKEKLHEL